MASIDPDPGLDADLDPDPEIDGEPLVIGTEVPRRVGELLDRVVRDLGAPGADVLTETFGHWDAIAGERFAPHVRPVAIRSETLVVAVSDPAWATEIRYRQAELLDRLAARVGTRRLTRVEVRIEHPV